MTQRHLLDRRKCLQGNLWTVGMSDAQFMWEILVPTIRRNDGKPIKTRYHRVWDAKVRNIANGLTILSPAKGQWIARDGELFVERMIPVRIMCTEEQINSIVDMTLKYYDQLAVLAYRISDIVIMRHANA